MYKGTSASAGIGIGKAAIVEDVQLVITKESIGDAEAEIARFKAALEQSIEDTGALAADLATRVGEKEAEILNGHLMLLSDPMLIGEIENSIKNDGVNSEFAIEQVCNTYADMFASMGDELMQQRATDMRHIKTRMQKVLLGVTSVDIAALPAGSVIVPKDLTPHDGRHQYGQCYRYHNGTWRTHFSQCHSGQSAGDPGSGGAWRHLRTGEGRRYGSAGRHRGNRSD